MPVHAAISASSRRKRTTLNGISATWKSPLAASDQGLGSTQAETLPPPLAAAPAAPSTNSMFAPSSRAWHRQTPDQARGPPPRARFPRDPPLRATKRATGYAVIALPPAQQPVALFR